MLRNSETHLTVNNKTPTCHLQSLEDATLALFLHNDATLVHARVGSPGGAELVLRRGVRGGGGVDLEVVPKEHEGLRQVLCVAAADADQAAEGDRGPCLHRVVGQRLEADLVDGVPCRGGTQQATRQEKRYRGLAGLTHAAVNQQRDARP